MAKAERDDAVTLGVGGCTYQPKGVTCARTAAHDCAKCGWNPENGVRERRVAKAMREYAFGVDAGKILPAIW